MSTAFFDEVHERYGDPQKFIKALRSKMALHGIRQNRLADRAGFAPVRISEWFSGRVDPQMESMVVLDEALDHIIRGE